MENQPQHYRRDHPQENMDKRQATAALAFMLGLFAEMNTDKAEQTTPEHHNNGKNGTKLNHYFKRICGIAFKTQQMTDNNHMTSTGNR